MMEGFRQIWSIAEGDERHKGTSLFSACKRQTLMPFIVGMFEIYTNSSLSSQPLPLCVKFSNGLEIYVSGPVSFILQSIAVVCCRDMNRKQHRGMAKLLCFLLIYI